MRTEYSRLWSMNIEYEKLIFEKDICKIISN